MTALRVLVTGVSGKLGRHIRARLDAANDVEPIYLAGPHGGGLDLADQDSIRRTVDRARPDAVIHLAGLIGDACETDPELTRAINVDAVGVLASSAADAGATRFIFASSAAVYGDQLTSPISEDAPTDGRSAYAISKLAAEALLRDLALPALHRVSLRIFNVYGDGFTGSLVNRLIASTAIAPVTLNDLDTFVRDYVHADDVAAAFDASLRLTGEFSVYNVGSGEPVSNRELVARLEREYSLHYLTVDSAPSYSCADIGKARRELRLSPALLA